jgi:hypothetical protein
MITAVGNMCCRPCPAHPCSILWWFDIFFSLPYPTNGTGQAVCFGLLHWGNSQWARAAQPPVTAGQLADLSGLSTGSDQSCGRLIEGGFARRDRSETDRRQVIIYLAPDSEIEGFLLSSPKPWGK